MKRTDSNAAISRFLCRRVSAPAFALAATIGALSSGPAYAASDYHPNINPALFQAQVDNPYFPLKPGTTYHYTEKSEEGLNKNDVTVTRDTKMIMGVPCTVVHDVLMRNGKQVEDTLDWYSQDKDGNVWYFGEDTKEYDESGKFITEGSWEAGVKGAQPGILMRGHPIVGEELRIEYLRGVAEDKGKVETLHDQPITVPAGTFKDVLRTAEWSDLEQGTEYKWYARGVGVVREKSEKNEWTILQSITQDP